MQLRIRFEEASASRYWIAPAHAQDGIIDIDFQNAGTCYVRDGYTDLTIDVDDGCYLACGAKRGRAGETYYFRVAGDALEYVNRDEVRANARPRSGREYMNERMHEILMRQYGGEFPPVLATISGGDVYVD